MAAGGAFSVLLICFLLTPGCLTGKNQQLSYENWHQMLEGEWMVKLYVRFWRRGVNLKFINRCMCLNTDVYPRSAPQSDGDAFILTFDH